MTATSMSVIGLTLICAVLFICEATGFNPFRWLSKQVRRFGKKVVLADETDPDAVIVGDVPHVPGRRP